MPPAPRPRNRQLVRDIGLSVLAIVSVSIGIYQVSHEPVTRITLLDGIDLAIVGIFWIDFVTEIRRWGSAREYVRTHWWELPSLIPAIPALVVAIPAVALLRVVRLLRLVRVVGVILRLRPAGSLLVQVARRARLDIIFSVAAGVVAAGTLLAYAVESGANPRMATWGDALWFALNMFTNVAYLDFQPATAGGRLVAAILQLCGIAFIGIFTASLASAIIREGPEARE